MLVGSAGCGLSQSATISRRLSIARESVCSCVLYSCSSWWQSRSRSTRETERSSRSMLTLPTRGLRFDTFRCWLETNVPSSANRNLRDPWVESIATQCLGSLQPQSSSVAQPWFQAEQGVMPHGTYGQRRITQRHAFCSYQLRLTGEASVTMQRLEPPTLWPHDSEYVMRMRLQTRLCHPPRPYQRIQHSKSHILALRINFPFLVFQC